MKGKVAVITGGTGVLGGSIAKSLAEAGANVIVIGRSPDHLREKLAELSQYHNISGYACDVLDKEKLESINAAIKDKFGKIDILINAAGGNIAGATIPDNSSIFELNIDILDKVLDINLKGTVIPCMVFGKTMSEVGSGSIINISSMTSITALTRVAGYSMAKSGVDIFTKWMAQEMAIKFNEKIRVNAIAPGFFIGNQNKAMLINEDGSYTERSKKILARTPMRRFGDISELNGLVHFLCSSSASFITGAIIPVDGGFSSFSGI